MNEHTNERTNEPNNYNDQTPSCGVNLVQKLQEQGKE